MGRGTLKSNFDPPFNNSITDKDSNVTESWNWFIRSLADAVQSLGQESTFQLLNGLLAKSFATTDVNTSTDVITETSHPYYTGLVGRFTTTGSLPGGLSLATDYYVIKVSANTYAVATSLRNAEAGTKVNLSSVGSGTHTFTPRGDITNFKFNARGVSAAFVDFLIQRVTTSTGATELIEAGQFVVSFNPTSQDWSLTMIGTPGPDDSGVDLSIDANGQVQYVSSLITGTESISKIIWRARVFAGKHTFYSSVGSR